MQITHIKLESNTLGLQDQQGITEVKTSQGNIYTVSQVAMMINKGIEFFYTTVWNSHAIVEVVNNGDTQYIRTKGNHTRADNLLSLPKC